MYRKARATSVVYGVLALMLFSIGLLPFSALQSAQAAPALQSGIDVGILKGLSGCPSASTEEIGINMDNQDNGGSYTYGWVGATFADSYPNIDYRFCRVSGASFANTVGRYAVLMLGSSCPQGAIQYVRNFDNEDRKTKNSHYGNMAPSDMPNNGNAYIVFCLFNNTTGNPLPHFGVEYGVFSGQFYDGYIVSDDENTRNANFYEANGSRSSTPSYPDIIDGVSDTLLYVKRIPS